MYRADGPSKILAKINNKAYKLELPPEFGVSNERLGPDLLWGRGKSIGEDLDVDDEGSEQNFEPLQSLHHYSVGYQSMQHELTSPRRLIPASAIENTSKNKKECNQTCWWMYSSRM
jgi:hypothetical protein